METFRPILTLFFGVKLGFRPEVELMEKPNLLHRQAQEVLFMSQQRHTPATQPQHFFKNLAAHRLN